MATIVPDQGNTTSLLSLCAQLDDAERTLRAIVKDPQVGLMLAERSLMRIDRIRNHESQSMDRIGTPAPVTDLANRREAKWLAALGEGRV